MTPEALSRAQADKELFQDLLRFFRENEHHPECACGDDALHADSLSIRALLDQHEANAR